MANSNFVVKNGLTVGALTIDASTGNITTSGTISGDLATASIAKNDSSIALNDTGSGSDIDVTIDGTSIFTITGSGIVPSVNSNGSTGFDLGSSNFAWKDVYVSSGSLYVNGQKVLQDDSGTIVVSADANQNLSFQTSGSGNVEMDATGTGLIAVKSTLQIEDGINITNSAGNAITFANSIDVDAIESRSTDTNLTLSANGTGVVTVNDNCTITGNLTVSGTTTTVNSETISLADNMIDLNSNFTSGTPSENSGIRVMRGDSTNVTFIWDEGNDRWTVGSSNMVAGTFIGALTGNVTGNVTGDVTGDLTGDSAGTHTGAVVGNVTGNASGSSGSCTGNAATATSATSATLASTVTISANNTANETVYLTFVDGATGTQGLETDTNLSYNPSTNVLATTASQAQYADLAERYEAEAPVEPGTVVHFGGTKEIKECDEDGCSKVAGIISTTPAYMMNADAGDDSTHPYVALKGRVPCKVQGSIKKGDMMVSAGNGRARAEADPKMGSVIGKAIADSEGEAVIEVVVL